MGMMEWERNPVRGEEEQVISECCSAFTAFFLDAVVRVNLLFPIAHGRCWGEEHEQSCVCELFSHTSSKTLPLVLEGAGCFLPGDSALPRWSPQHRSSFTSVSQGTAWAGTRAATSEP